MRILLAIAAGVSIGIFFYGCLWITVRRLMTSKHPVLLTFGSFWGRTVIALAGFFFVMNGQWQNGLGCLAGFGLGRIVVSGLLSRNGGAPKCT
jgi:F1F0 ATPase subunit 2